MNCCLHIVSGSVSPYVSHKPGRVTSCFTHFRACSPSVLHFHPHRNFQLAYCYYFRPSIPWLLSTSWRPKTWSLNLAKTRMLSLLTTRSLAHTSTTSTCLASDGTDVPWPYALCNDDPSSLLASCWHTSSTIDDLIVLNTPNMDSADAAFPTYTTDVFTTTSRPRQSYTSTTYSYPEIAETYVITWRKLCHSWRLHLSSYWNPASGTMETWRRFPWLQQGHGLDFPSKIRQSRFSSYKDIEGMDPLQVPLWKFLYQGLHNTWLRRVAYGRETFVLPFDNIGTTVFVAELVSQLRTRNVDLDKLATFRSRSAGQCVNQKEATQNMAKEVAQLLQSWLPAQPSADVASQQRILELEAELAKMKSDNGTPPPTAPEGTTPATTPIGRALQGQPAASTSFDPSSLLISPGICQFMACGQPTFVADRDPVQEMVERLETPSTQTRHVGKAVGESQWMVAKPTGWRLQNHPESQCSDGHWSVQTQGCNDWWDCPQGHDGGFADALLTSFVFEITRLKSSPNYTNSGRGTFLYSCFGSLDSFHLVPFCWCLLLFGWSKLHWWASMCYYIHEPIQNWQALLKGTKWWFVVVRLKRSIYNQEINPKSRSIPSKHCNWSTLHNATRASNGLYLRA